MSRKTQVRLSPFDRHDRSSGRRGQGGDCCVPLGESVRGHENRLHRVGWSAAPAAA